MSSIATRPPPAPPAYLLGPQDLPHGTATLSLLPAHMKRHCFWDPGTVSEASLFPPVPVAVRRTDWGRICGCQMTDVNRDYGFQTLQP